MGEYAQRGGRRSYLHPLRGPGTDWPRLYNERAMDSPWVTCRIDYDLKMLLRLYPVEMNTS